jgi:hypothetical protein
MGQGSVVLRILRSEMTGLTRPGHFSPKQLACGLVPALFQWPNKESNSEVTKQLGLRLSLGLILIAIATLMASWASQL